MVHSSLLLADKHRSYEKEINSWGTLSLSLSVCFILYTSSFSLPLCSLSSTEAGHTRIDYNSLSSLHALDGSE